ncbi:Adenine deaminase (fragment) [Desulfamplus magnetovallimortis]|uniref:Adenine deaminase n=1 Tax=Desulfamplus magnetovallimortis TaxID=1246637 RepID=A0A1W1HGP5_9BACT
MIKEKNRETIISAATGKEPVDILFTNAKVINVFTGEILEQSVAVKEGYICGFGNYDAVRRVDLEGMYVAPGLMDSHVHIESSMVTPVQFSRGVLPFGTTTVIADPHEIANVLGTRGIEYMVQSAEKSTMNILFSMPSCVPATDMETTGATLNAEAIAPFMQNNRIVALAEMMNYPGVISADSQVMAKIKAAHKIRKPVDGHAPGVSGRDLWAYAAAGISSDHECTTTQEALEKLRLGMHIMVREGTCAKKS